MLVRKLLDIFYNSLICWKFKSFGRKSRISFPATVNLPKSIKVGNKVWVREHAWLNCDKRHDDNPTLEIGDGTYIGRFVHINAYESVVMEPNVLISDRVFISDVHHEFSDSNIPIIHQGVTKPKPIRLKEGCWIGVGVSIMPGVTIGKNAVVAANAVVTRDVPDNMVARGVPARIFEKSSQGKDWII